MSQIHFAVLDVGNTNKKLQIYTTEYQIVHTLSAQFPEKSESGLVLEPIDEIMDWFLQGLKEAAGLFRIGAIAVSAHGGSFVCLDRNGNLSIPMLFNAHDPGSDFHARFHERFGSPEWFHAETSTPPLPYLICIGKGIAFVKEQFPEAFAQTAHILGMPQYIGYRLTGNLALEKTYLGNHTYLWNFRKQEFSSFVDKLDGLGYMNLISMIFEIEMLMSKLKRSIKEKLAVFFPNPTGQIIQTAKAWFGEENVVNLDEI